MTTSAITRPVSAHAAAAISAAVDGQEPSALFSASMDALDALRRGSYPERITCDEDAILIAHAVALRADCTRRRVGAVAFDTSGRVIGTGRNGAPPGYPGCLTAGACPRGRKSTQEVKPGAPYEAGGHCIAVHAEANCCLYSDPIARRGGLMAITDAPCDGCSTLIAGSGLARAIWADKDEGGRWVIYERLLGYPHPVGGHYA